MTRRRKAVLIALVLGALAVHAWFLAAGGTWRTLGLALLAVDAFSAWFIVGAVREARKLDRQEELKQRTFEGATDRVGNVQ